MKVMEAAVVTLVPLQVDRPRSCDTHQGVRADHSSTGGRESNGLCVVHGQLVARGWKNRYED